MTKDAYDSVVIQDKKSDILLCGAVDKKVPATKILRPDKPSVSAIEDALKPCSKDESEKKELCTYRIFHLGKTADMFFENYAGHRFWDDTCEGKLEFDMEFDKQMAFGWREKLKCAKCGFTGKTYNLYRELETGRHGPKSADINLSVAVGLLDTKIGPNDLRYLLVCLKIPPPSYKSMQTHCNFAADKVTEVAEASFHRARCQVIENNEACGFGRDCSIIAGVDSQYNNSLRHTGETTPMQPATQVSTTIIEMQTKHKKVIAMNVGSKLCSHRDAATCNKVGGCSKNLKDNQSIGDECREAKLAMEAILNSDSPVTINNMVTDGDSNAFKGANEAQMAMCGKPMQRMADVVHLTKTMRNKITRTVFSPEMFPARTKRDCTYIQRRFAKDVCHRVQCEFKNLQKKFGNTNLSLLQEKCENVKTAIVDCYTGKCKETCPKFSTCCGGKPPVCMWKKQFMPKCKPLIIQGENRIKFLQCLDMRLGKDAVIKTRKAADTNKLEALHRGINASNPKDVTYRRNAKARKLSAAARLNDGRANSSIEKIKAEGAQFPSNTKVLRSLNKIQDKNIYDKMRQSSLAYKKHVSNKK